MKGFFYKVEGGCGFCGRKDGHWHEVDPKPLDVGYTPTPELSPPGPFVTSTWLGEWGGETEPSPVFQPGRSRVVWPALYAYLKKRVERGLEKYGQRLCTNDGRDGLHDALDESIDLSFYLMKLMLEEQDRRIHEYEGLKGGVESGY